MNRELHLTQWSKYYTLFPPNWRPPLRLESSFDLQYLTKDVLNVYNEQASD